MIKTKLIAALIFVTVLLGCRDGVARAWDHVPSYESVIDATEQTVVGVVKTLAWGLRTIKYVFGAGGHASREGAGAAQQLHVHFDDGFIKILRLYVALCMDKVVHSQELSDDEIDALRIATGLLTGVDCREKSLDALLLVHESSLGREDDNEHEFSGDEQDGHHSELAG